MTRGKNRRTRSRGDIRRQVTGKDPKATSQGPAFDDVTAIPDVPIKEYVKKAMAEADVVERRESKAPPARGPARPRPPPAPAPEIPDLVLESALDSIPPAAPRDSAVSVDSAATPTLDDEVDELLLESSESVPEVASPDPAVHELHMKFVSGDYSGVIKLAESLRSTGPTKREIESYVQRSRDALEQILEAALGDVDQLVVLAVPPEHLRWLSLDHRAGFFLSLVDGSCTLAELFDISGMPRTEAMRVANMLLEQRIIAFEKK